MLHGAGERRSDAAKRHATRSWRIEPSWPRRDADAAADARSGQHLQHDDAGAGAGAGAGARPAAPSWRRWASTPPARVQVLDINAMKALQRLLTERRPRREAAAALVRAGRPRADSAWGNRWRAGGGVHAPAQGPEGAAAARARQVTQQIGAQLYHPLSQLYVQAYFPESTRRDITEMVGHIKDEFATPPAQQPLAGRGRPARRRWKSWARSTSRSATRQSGSISARVDIRPDDYFGNVQRASRFALQRDTRQARQAGGGRTLRDADQDHADRRQCRLQPQPTPSTSRRPSCSRRSTCPAPMRR